MEQIESNKKRVEIRISENENYSLQELFNASFNNQATQIPLTQRNLPKSFFVPPNHSSNKSSNNSINSNAPITDVGATGAPPPPHPGSAVLTGIFHCKANSSPARINEPNNPKMFVPSINPASIASNIMPGNTVNNSPNNNMNNNPNNSMSSSNPNSSTTSTGSSSNCNYKSAYSSNRSETIGASLKFQISDLPPHYQMALNSENKVYFLNHLTKETTWFDPRLPPDKDAWGLTEEELSNLHLKYYNAKKSEEQKLLPLSALSSESDAAKLPINHLRSSSQPIQTGSVSPHSHTNMHFINASQHSQQQHTNQAGVIQHQHHLSAPQPMSQHHSKAFSPLINSPSNHCQQPQPQQQQQPSPLIASPSGAGPAPPNSIVFRGRGSSHVGAAAAKHQLSPRTSLAPSGGLCCLIPAGGNAAPPPQQLHMQSPQQQAQQQAHSNSPYSPIFPLGLPPQRQYANMVQTGGGISGEPNASPQQQVMSPAQQHQPSQMNPMLNPGGGFA